MMARRGSTSIARHRQAAEPPALTLLAIAAPFCPSFGRDHLTATPPKGAQIPAAAPSNRSTVSSC